MTTTHYIAALMFVAWMALFFTVPKQWRGLLNATCAIIFTGTIALMTITRATS